MRKYEKEQHVFKLLGSVLASFQEFFALIPMALQILEKFRESRKIARHGIGYPVKTSVGFDLCFGLKVESSFPFPMIFGLTPGFPVPFVYSAHLNEVVPLLVSLPWAILSNSVRKAKSRSRWAFLLALRLRPFRRRWVKHGETSALVALRHPRSPFWIWLVSSCYSRLHTVQMCSNLTLPEPVHGWRSKFIERCRFLNQLQCSPSQQRLPNTQGKAEWHSWHFHAISMAFGYIYIYFDIYVDIFACIHHIM